MTLAYLLATDEDNLICDFAQYYGIYDMESQIPCRTASILACGLPPESRIMRKMSNSPIDTTDTILAGIFDSLNNLMYMMSGKRHRKKPQSLLDKLLNTEKTKKKQENIVAFSSAEEFERIRKQIIEGR